MGKCQAEFSYPRFAVCLLMALAAVAAVYTVMYTRPWESAIERAHRLCRVCGLEADEIDGLIANVRHSTLTGEQNLELFDATFEDPSQAELCVPCVEAMLITAES